MKLILYNIRIIYENNDSNGGNDNQKNDENKIYDTGIHPLKIDDELKMSNTPATPMSQDSTTKCPLCNLVVTQQQTKSRVSVKGRVKNEKTRVGLVQHFVHQCPSIQKGICEEVEKTKLKETEMIIKCDGVSLRKICIIGNYLSKKIKNGQW